MNASQSTQFSDLLSGMHHFFETQECCLADGTKHVHLVLVSTNWLLTVSNLSRKAHMAAGLQHGFDVHVSLQRPLQLLE